MEVGSVGQLTQAKSDEEGMGFNSQAEFEVHSLFGLTNTLTLF